MKEKMDPSRCFRDRRIIVILCAWASNQNQFKWHEIGNDTKYNVCHRRLIKACCPCRIIVCGQLFCDRASFFALCWLLNLNWEQVNQMVLIVLGALATAKWPRRGGRKEKSGPVFAMITFPSCLQCVAGIGICMRQTCRLLRGHVIWTREIKTVSNLDENVRQ